MWPGLSGFLSPLKLVLKAFCEFGPDIYTFSGLPPMPKLPFDRRQLIDLAIRTILAVTFAFLASGYFKNAFDQLRAIDPAHADMRLVSHSLSVIAIGLYTFMIASLYVLRLRPVNATTKLWPRIIGILGGFLIAGLLFLSPRQDLPLPVEVTASVLVLAGNILAVVILTRLGRSFSIVPEARRLVTTGPYSVIRHPLYFAEAVATIGTLICFWSPAAIIIVVTQFALQLARIHYEENVLRATFPEYAEYARRTSRLIPGVY
jgi:protein-S-isoprenylcysteine O-methyltransferase Ste14